MQSISFFQLRILKGFRDEKPLVFLPKHYILFAIAVSSLRRMPIRLSVGERRFLLKIRTPWRVLAARGTPKHLLAPGITEKEKGFYVLT